MKREKKIIVTSWKAQQRKRGGLQIEGGGGEAKGLGFSVCRCCLSGPLGSQGLRPCDHKCQCILPQRTNGKNTPPALQKSQLVSTISFTFHHESGDGTTSSPGNWSSGWYLCKPAQELTLSLIVCREKRIS